MKRNLVQYVDAQGHVTHVPEQRRNVTSRHIDPITKDWVIELECGHVVRKANLFLSVVITSLNCNQCIRNSQGGK